MSTHAPQAAQAVTLPTTLDEAVAALTAMPAAVPVAGGTDLMAAVNSGQLRPTALVGLGRISEIRGWQYLDGHALLGERLDDDLPHGHSWRRQPSGVYEHRAR